MTPYTITVCMSTNNGCVFGGDAGCVGEAIPEGAAQAALLQPTYEQGILLMAPGRGERRGKAAEEVFEGAALQLTLMGKEMFDDILLPIGPALYSVEKAISR